MKHAASSDPEQDRNLKVPSGEDTATVTSTHVTDEVASTIVGSYQLYRDKQRWIGVFAMFMLGTASATSWPWFGPISNRVARDFGFTLDQVNWLGNVIACVSLPTVFLTPLLANRYGVKRCCDVAAVLLLVSAWVRYAGTVRSLSKGGAYAFIIIGQALSGVSQAIFRILVTKYSERWIDPKGRTIATMVLFIAYPTGGVLAQVLSPAFSDTRKSILALAVISTVVAPIDFLVLEAPSTSTSYASLRLFHRAVMGHSCPPESYMTKRERWDYHLLVNVFSPAFAAFNTFPILSSQWLTPYGYSDTVSGLMGAAMLLSGVVTAIAILPILDRILTHHLGITLRILCPFIAVSWVSLIGAVRAHDTAPLFVIFVVIGACSITFFYVAIELTVAVTRNPDWSPSALLFSANIYCIIFVAVQGSFRSLPTANPPLNIYGGIIYNGAYVFVTCMLVFFIRSNRARYQRDVRMNEEQRTQGLRLNHIATLPPQEEPPVKG